MNAARARAPRHRPGAVASAAVDAALIYRPGPSGPRKEQARP